jgi:hypothetical protein
MAARSFGKAIRTKEVNAQLVTEVWGSVGASKMQRKVYTMYVSFLSLYFFSSLFIAVIIDEINMKRNIYIYQPRFANTRRVK